MRQLFEEPRRLSVAGVGLEAIERPSTNLVEAFDTVLEEVEGVQRFAMIEDGRARGKGMAEAMFIEVNLTVT